MLIKPDGMDGWINPDYIVYAKERQEGYSHPNLYLANGSVIPVKAIPKEVLFILVPLTGGVWVNPKFVTSVGLQIDRTAAYHEGAQYAPDIKERFTKVRVDLAAPRPDTYLWAPGNNVTDLKLWAEMLK